MYVIPCIPCCDSAMESYASNWIATFVHAWYLEDHHWEKGLIKRERYSSALKDAYHSWRSSMVNGFTSQSERCDHHHLHGHIIGICCHLQHFNSTSYHDPMSHAPCRAIIQSPAHLRLSMIGGNKRFRSWWWNQHIVVASRGASLKPQNYPHKK